MRLSLTRVKVNGMIMPEVGVKVSLLPFSLNFTVSPFPEIILSSLMRQVSYSISTSSVSPVIYAHASVKMYADTVTMEPSARN